MHKISKVKFDIKFDSEKNALDYEELFAVFAQKNLMNTADGVLCANSIKDSIIRINKLKIDLGDILINDFKEEMPNKLKKKLDEKIKEKISILKNSSSSKEWIKEQNQKNKKNRWEGIISKTDSDIELIKIFLLTGIFPGTINKKHSFSIEKKLYELLDSDIHAAAEMLRYAVKKDIPKKRLKNQVSEKLFTYIISITEKKDVLSLQKILIDALVYGKMTMFKKGWEHITSFYPQDAENIIQIHGKKEHVRKRIASLFDDTQMDQLIYLIEPQNKDFISQFIKKPQKLKTKEITKRADTKKFKTQIREFILAYLLVEKQGIFNKKMFTRSIIKKIASAYNQNHLELLSEIIILVQIHEPETEFKKALLNILSDLKNKDAPLNKNQNKTSPLYNASQSAKSDEKPDKIPDKKSYILFLKNIIKDTIIYGKTSGFKKAWENIITLYPQTAEKLIKTHGKKEDIRKRMAVIFNDEQTDQLIYLIEPQNKDFISEFIKKPQKLKTKEIAGRTDTKTFKIQIKEFTFTYLLTQKQSIFNRKMFTGSVIKKIASHYNQKYSDLLSEIIILAKTSQHDTLFKKELINILSDLQNEPVHLTDKNIKPPDLLPDTFVIVLENILKDALVYGKMSEFKKTWEKIITLYPENAEKLIKTYGKKEYVRKRIASAFDDTQIDQLIFLIEPENKDFISDFIKKPQNLKTQKITKKADTGKFKTQIREFALTYLLAEKQSTFNKKMFTGSIIKKTAAHYNQKYTDLLSEIIIILKESREDIPLKKELLDILYSLSQKKDKSIKRKTEEAAIIQEDKNYTEGEEDGDADTLYNKIIKQILLPDSAQKTEKNIEKLFSRLSAHYPEHIKKLFNQLKNRALLLEQFFKILSDKELKEIVTQYYTHLPKNSGKFFLDSLLIFEQNIKNRHKYYKKILKNIIYGKNIDLEKISDMLSAKKDSSREKELPAKYESEHKQENKKLKTLIDFLTGKTAYTSDFPLNILESIIEDEPEKLSEFINTNISDKNILKKITKHFPQKHLKKALALIFPVHTIHIQKSIDFIHTKWTSAFLSDTPDKIRRLEWEFTFNYIKKTDSLHFNQQEFIKQLIIFLAAETGKKDKKEYLSAVIKQVEKETQISDNRIKILLNNALKSISENTIHPDAPGLENIFGSEKEEYISESGLKDMPQHKKETQNKEDKDIEYEHTEQTEYIDDTEDSELFENIEKIYISNAGMVIAAPYLPRLFGILDLITEKSKFKNQEAAERGIHILQYMVNQKTETPEYELVLNKFLCGVKTGVPIIKGINITDKEKDTVNSMIKGMIANWKKIGNTSVQGFRESFLQRNGILTQKENNAWRLKVDPKTFDMLLDTLPWSFSVIRFPWMDKIVHVTWR